MKREFETFVRSFDELAPGRELPLILRDLTPGPRKYRARHVKALLAHPSEAPDDWDLLWVRSGVGLRHPQPWAIKITEELPDAIPGRPYEDVYAALRRLAEAR